MQVYVQKSMSTTRPRSPFIVSGSVLNQWPGWANSGAAPSGASFGVVTPGRAASLAARLAGRGDDVVVVELRLAAQAGQLVLDGGALLQAAGRVGQERGEVVGQRLLEAQVDAREHEHRGEQHHRAEAALQPAAAAACAHALDDAPAAERQAEQHERRAEPVGDRHRDDLRRRARRGADGDDRGEDRAGARRVDEAERAADRQPRPEAVGVAARREALQERQAQLEPVRRGRDEQRDAEQREHDDRRGAQDAVADPDAVDDRGDADDRDDVRERQPGDDPDRPPPAAGAAGRQQRGEDRQHARRDRGGGAGEEGEGEQEDHRVRVSSPRSALRMNEGAPRRRSEPGALY